MGIFKKDEYGHPRLTGAGRKKLIKGIAFGLFIFIVGVELLSNIRSVKAGTVQVVTRFGRVTGRVLQPGLNWTIPFTESTITYNTKKVTYETSSEESQKTSKANYKDYPVDTTTNDGQGVKVTYTVRFRVDSTKATWLVDHIGPESAVVEKVVKTDSRAWVRTIIRDFNSDDLYSGNIRDVQDRIFDTLQPMFADNGLVLDEFLLREPRFDAKYEQVMEAKKVAAEQVEVEKQKALQEEKRKQQRITAAEGQAEEQRLQRETLTDELLRKQWIEAWQSGGAQVPDFICGEGSNMLFNMPVK